MMRRRMVGRQVARVAVGTAVVAGTAGAVHHHQDQKYAKQDYEKQMAAQQQQATYDQQDQMAEMQQQMEMQQQQIAQMQQQSAPPPQPAPQAAPAGTDLTSQLQQLAQLHTAGVLSDEEFAAAKQKLLSGG